MHKFTLQIEIPDKDYCNGCGALVDIWNWCFFHRLNMEKRVNMHKEEEYIRPDICKQNDKEAKC